MIPNLPAPSLGELSLAFHFLHQPSTINHQPSNINPTLLQHNYSDTSTSLIALRLIYSARAALPDSLQENPRLLNQYSYTALPGSERDQARHQSDCTPSISHQLRSLAHSHPIRKHTTQDLFEVDSFAVGSLRCYICISALRDSCHQAETL